MKVNIHIVKLEHLMLICICVLCNCSGSDSSRMLSGVKPVWPLLMIASSAFQAGAFIIKVKKNEYPKFTGTLHKQNN